MARLAMLAAVLLALVPTMTRLSGAADAHELSGAMPATMKATAMPVAPMAGHMSGMAAMKMPSIADNATSKRLPLRHHHDHDDCAYCNLLNTMAGLALVLLLLLPQAAPVHPWRSYRRPRIAVFNPCGLGSRGPPLIA